ncbi:Lipid droplet-associated hydrolase [Heracleum sosnowskyi]|uniref:Lipid droplet-associated hydrolase n=1 Tax=Heracleum sosnowskyi TaxID=360622 RepID=A0AAD8JJ19_9APIA|nr:Lipid droplet-associated hydrolase [Heracleum sosnowskyi]
MLFQSFLSPYARARSFSLLIHSRSISVFKGRANSQMDRENSNLIAPGKHTATFRLSNVSGRKADLLEIPAKNPILHVLFIPGNPGVISFYTDFLESLYELLGGTASITAIGQISQMKKNLEGGRLFSLEEQIDHKVNFIKQELNNIEVPIVLVAHSIGCYISIELLRRFSPKVIYCIELYPFLAVNNKSFKQSIIRKTAASPFLCASLSSIAALLGLLPTSLTRFLVRQSVGKSWSSTAVDALCNNLLQYHVMQNVFFMARTEFIKLLKSPDWAFLRKKQSQIAFLFGDDDHWGPLQMSEEISAQVPKAHLVIEREGFTHAFSCTEKGSVWVAQFVAILIKKQISK